MNGPIRKVTVFVAVLMALLLLNLTWISVVRHDALNEDGRNRRVRDAEFSRNRGAILVGNEPIAQSVQRSGRFPYIRTYPEPELWSTVTGWYSYDYARSGLEASYNGQLAGTSSEQSVGRVLDVLTGQRSQGANVSTTLNPAAQAAAVRALGKQRGAVVAMNYTTGEILALVSTPTYDPNRLATVDLKAEREAWVALLDAKDEPLKNRATREIYPPGSTFKLVTAAAALEDGLVPSSELDAPRSLRLPNSSRSMGNSTNCGGERVTLEQALKTSCNTAFGNLGLQLGAEKLREQAEKFGFNAEQSIDIGAATSKFPTELDEAQTALSAIGQYDVAASPLQIAQVAAAIANDGVMMRPYLVNSVTNTDLTVLAANGPGAGQRADQPVVGRVAEADDGRHSGRRHRPTSEDRRRRHRGQDRYRPNLSRPAAVRVVRRLRGGPSGGHRRVRRKRRRGPRRHLRRPARGPHFQGRVGGSAVILSAFSWRWRTMVRGNPKGTGAMTERGALLGGRYQLEQVIGRGGMAEVWRARDTRLERDVAVKRLRVDLASDPMFQARFRREAQSAAGLNHPNIVAVYDTGEEREGNSDVLVPYIVMELVEGVTLREVLRDGRKILPERALEFTAGVLDALAYSHRAGIIHRDIKPANVMLTLAAPSR